MPRTLSHENQIVAVYDDDEAAAAARDTLLEAGVPETAIQLVSAPAATTPPAPETAGDQILSAFMSLFGSAEEHHRYAQTVGRGHAMVLVTPADETDRHHLAEMLERTHPVDFDAKLAEWRQADEVANTDAPTGRSQS